MNFRNIIHRFLNNKSDHNIVLFIVGIALAAGLLVDFGLRNMKLPPHPYVLESTEIQKSLLNSKERVKGRLFVYFIDCLRFDYAISKDKMPFLNTLLPKGTWGRVEPCLSNMTVHCVESAFSGRDRSSLLSFSEDFHPKKSSNKNGWFFMMHDKGYKISAVSDYVVTTLYKDALFRSFAYEKNQKMPNLVDRAITYFNEKGVSMAMVHLLGPHDLGQAHGTVTAPYINSLRKTDDLLKKVVSQLKPEDTLLVFGDHGIDDHGKHTYNTDTPTFYLYMGPDFKENHRQDINILSHMFFLNTVFRLPFHQDYQGEVYWDALKPEVAQIYGTGDLMTLRRSSDRSSQNFSVFDYLLIITLLFISVIGIWFGFQSGVRMPWYLWLTGILAFPAIIFIGFVKILPLVMLAATGLLIWFARKKEKLDFITLIPAVLLGAFMIFKALVYRRFDILIHDIKIYNIYFFYFFEILISFAAVHWFYGKTEFMRKFVSACLLSALTVFLFNYPSLYHYGIIRAIPFYLIIIISSLSLGIISKKSETNLKPIVTIILLGAVAFLATQISMFVENFRIFHFKYVPVKSSLLHITWSLSTWIALISVYIYHFKPSLKSSLITAATAVLLIPFMWGFVKLPLIFFALLLPAILAGLIILPFYKRTYGAITLIFFSTMLELSYMYSFNPGSLYQLCGFLFISGVLSIFAEQWDDSTSFLTAVPLIMIVMMLLVVGFGYRTCGIDFKFAVKWFPHLFEKLWVVVTLSAFVKYFLAIQLAFFFFINKPLVFKRLFSILSLIVAAMVPFILTMYFRGGKVTLIIDSLEETLYTTGALLFSLTAAILAQRFKSKDQAVSE
ncbi:sulfatase-like hydrolase/transferase [Myxococcota bacterium]|nr:sulfatase-like hydrolase/transferase [Myxococcota bacterium]MBU1381400.1 sulfatase-like hydrolase/transferase [Myxococcota bacterium]MBU1498414.1 sulfatase-like hydrolase/transferase [Myxococcota bacterium]